MKRYPVTLTSSVIIGQDLGSEEVIVTIRRRSGTPIPNVLGWITTDINETNLVTNREKSNSSGQIRFYIDPGNYYLWLEHPNHKFNSPIAFTQETS